MQLLHTKITTLWLLLFLSLTTGLHAQNISVSAVLRPSTIGLNDQAILTVKVNGSGRSVPAPVLPKTDVFNFYPSGNSSSYQFVNGRMSVSKQHTYTVVPTQKGKFKLGSVTVTRQGKTVSSAPLVLTVVDASVAQKTIKRNTPAQQQSGPKQSIFLKTKLSRSTTYVNQQLILTYELYSNTNLAGVSFSHYPPMTGFWTEELAIPKGKNQSIVTLNGKRYLRVILKRVALFPLSQGRIIIPAAKVSVQVENRRNDPFAGFFQQAHRRSPPREIATDPVSIKVHALPTTQRPVNFKGAVGTYTLKATADQTTIPAGDPVTVTIKISGQGNIKTVTDPILPQLGDFETYASGSKVKASKKNNILSGTKTYNYVFIPKSEGLHKIGAITFSFFDPVQKKFKTLSTPEILITATPGEHLNEHRVSGSVSKEDVKILDRDIRYIHTTPGTLTTTKQHLFISTWFWLLQCIPLLIIGMSLGYRHHTSRLSSDVRYARNRRAHRSAQRRLKKAHALLTHKKSADICSAEISSALIDFIGNKLNIAATGTTTAQIMVFLQEKEVDKDIIKLFHDCFEACDYARFAPSAVSHDDVHATMNRAEKAILSLEREKLS